MSTRYALLESGSVVFRTEKISEKESKKCVIAEFIELMSASVEIDTAVSKVVLCRSDDDSGGMKRKAMIPQAGIVGVYLNVSRHLNLSSTIGPISSIATTQSSVIAQNKNGEVFVWGVGVLGMGPEAEVLKRPTRMDQPLFDGKKITSVSAGNSCMSATNESGRLFIWGENRYSSLGLGHSKRQLFPYQLFLPGDVRHVALGPDHSLFLVN
ncbi:unnamed protein product [Caenorhabditis nigoni]